MHVNYTGKLDDLTKEQRHLLEARYHRLGRQLDGQQGDKEARVILTQERYLHNSEITVNFLDHGLVGRGSDPDLFISINDAIGKLEKQLHRLLGRRRDGYRSGKDKFRGAGEHGEMPVNLPALEAPTPQVVNGKRIFEVDVAGSQKPMTLEEALIQMEGEESYFPYHDVETDHLSVLVRRPDGHLDLVRCQ